MRDKKVEDDIKKLQVSIVDTYCKSDDYKAAVLSMLSDTLGVLIGVMSTSEELTLDAIDLAHKCIRTSATNAYVEKQKLRKQATRGG